MGSSTDKNKKNIILCIGCSHSIGAYDLKNDIIDYNGWIKYMSDNIITNKRWRGISMPGCGILHYTLFLNELDKFSALRDHIDTIIIQHTSELRMTVRIYDDEMSGVLPGDSFNRLVYESSKSFFATEHIYEPFYLGGTGMNLFHRTTIDKDTIKFLGINRPSDTLANSLSVVMDTYADKLWSSGMMDIIIEGCMLKIKDICKRNDITLHEISWNESLKQLDEEDMHPNGYGHWKKPTVDKMNEIFYNELKDKLEN